MRDLSRCTDRYKLMYSLEKNENGYLLIVEKICNTEKSSVKFLIEESYERCEVLLKKLWSCKVTPMSIEYILEDEKISFKIIN